MKRLTYTFLVFLLSLTAGANEVPMKRLDGVFVYTDVDVAHIRDVEVIPYQNSERYGELQKQGFTCEFIAGFYKCVKFIRSAQLPQDLEAKIHQTWVGKAYEFIPGAMSPKLKNDSESLLEWDVFDTVRTNSDVAYSYHYYLLDSAVHKIKINFPAGEQWFLIHGHRHISIYLKKVVRLGKNQRREFDLLLNFTR